MRHLLTALLFCLGLPCAQAAQLQLELPSGTRSWDSSELLAHPQLRNVQILGDVAYKRDMDFLAVPIAALLDGVAPGDHLQVLALDGFAAELPAAALLAHQGAQAWLAVEDPSKPWSPLAPGKPSAGPFYLVWVNPEAGQIGPEQWPFQIARIRVLTPVAERFPALLPAANAPAKVQAGFVQFQKNCLACHRLNGAGDSHFGPDLNIPHNPTEYLAGDYLRQYIRNPQSLRKWPQAKMPGFSADVLSRGELDQLLAYLRHMAARKIGG